MRPTIEPITPEFAAEIGDIDLGHPLDAPTQQAIKTAFSTYSVLIFPDQHLSQDQHLEFATLFGPLEPHVSILKSTEKKRLPREFADVSNLDTGDAVWGKESRLRRFQLANRIWHTDSSFKFVPAKASLLYARSIPPIGGHTEFADLRAAYAALPKVMKNRLEGMIAEHCIRYSRALLGFDTFSPEEKQLLPPVPQMLVREIPETGRKNLYLASHAGRIFGLPDDEGLALLQELLAHATDRRFVYTHRYRTHDLVIWDNRCTLHRGTHFDDLRWRRDIQRATVSDSANTVEQAGLAVPECAVA